MTTNITTKANGKKTSLDNLLDDMYGEATANETENAVIIADEQPVMVEAFEAEETETAEAKFDLHENGTQSGNGIQDRYLANEITTADMVFAVCEKFKLPHNCGVWTKDSLSPEIWEARQNAQKSAIAFYLSKRENANKTTGSIVKAVSKFLGYVETVNTSGETSPRSERVNAAKPPQFDAAKFAVLMATSPSDANIFLADYTASVAAFNAEQKEISAKAKAAISANAAKKLGDAALAFAKADKAFWSAKVAFSEAKGGEIGEVNDQAVDIFLYGEF